MRQPFRSPLLLLIFLVPALWSACSKPTEFTIPAVACFLEPDNSECVGSLTSVPFPQDRTRYSVRGEVSFANETTIVVSNFTISNPPDGYIYLGYGGDAREYINSGLRISPRLMNLNDVDLTLNLPASLADLPYTHIAVVCVQFRFMINPGFQFKQ